MKTQVVREYSVGFPGGSAGKENTCNAGHLGLIPGLGRSPGEGKPNSFKRGLCILASGPSTHRDVALPF